MTKVIVMVGLQGSGKSTKAKELATKHFATILSSDEIRKENPDWDNQTVFNHIYKEMQKLIDNNKNVIIDATNITIKARKPIFQALRHCNAYVVAYVMTTPYDTCIMRVKARNEDKNEHYVPLEEVEKYLKAYETPFYNEGFDDIIFDGYPAVIFFDETKANRLLDEMKDFDQKSKHHTHKLLSHCSYAKYFLLQKTVNSHTIRDNVCLLIATLWHDIGKLYTQTFKDGEAHYYNHENVGTYVLLNNLEVLPAFGAFNQSDIVDILFYVNYHMRPFNWGTEKAKNKWREIFGSHKFNDLLLFNEADKEAC